MFANIFIVLKMFFSFGGNISKWLGTFLANWKNYVFATITGLMLYTMFSPWQFLFGLDTVPSLRADIHKIEARYNEARDSLAECKLANVKLSSVIDAQNDSIVRMGDISKKIDESSKKVMEKIDKLREQTKSDVEDILNEPAPETCQKAIDYLRDKAEGELSWRDKK